MARQPACVYCRRQPVDPAWRPFCSERCRMADLGRWLDGAYRAPDPGLSTGEDGDAAPARAPAPRKDDP